MESSRKRKPLSDITSAYNLIPTSTLRKLVASSTKPPISILKPSPNSTNQKFRPDSSNRSDSSIGSSDVRAVPNSRTVQFRTPTRANPSITSPERSKDAAYNRTQSIEKSNKAREAAAVIVTPILVEKRKDKGKTTAVPFSSPPPEKITDKNENEIRNSYSTPLEKKKQTEAANPSLLSGPVETVKEFGKGIPNSCSLSYDKTEKGKAIAHYFGCSIGKTKEIGKEFLDPSSSSSVLVERRKGKGKALNILSGSYEKTRDKEKEIPHPSSDIVEIKKRKGPKSSAMAVNCPPPRRKSERKKNDAGASSCPPVMRTKTIQIDLDEAADMKSSKSWTDPHGKRRKKSGSRIESGSELPLDFIKQQKAYFKEVDEFELPEEEISEDELD